MDNPDRKKISSLLTARLDRLPVMVLPISIVLALAFGYFIALYDVIDVGIAFSSTSLKYTGLTPGEASLVVSMGLFGYIPGALLLGYLGDKVGRKPMLMVTALLTAVGSLGNALAVNYPMFILFRFITGMGIGGDLILVPTYIVEMVPAKNRAKYFNLVYIAGWAGLGLGPFMASYIDVADPTIGWRVIFGIGATLALITLAIRGHASETVRMLALQGKTQQAENVVKEMEKKAMEKTGMKELPTPVPVEYEERKVDPFYVFKNPKYRVRVILIMLSVFFFYFGEYPYLTEFLLWTSGVSSLSHVANNVTLIYGDAGIATFLGAILLRGVVERVRRPILTTFAYGVGMLLGVIVAVLGASSGNLGLMAIGLVLTNLIGVGWSNQLNYLNGTENVPTYARGTAFAFIDGFAHLGAAISTAIILGLISSVGALPIWVGFQIPMVILGVILILILPNTIGKSLEEINEGKAGI